MFFEVYLYLLFLKEKLFIDILSDCSLSLDVQLTDSSPLQKKKNSNLNLSLLIKARSYILIYLR